MIAGKQQKKHKDRTQPKTYITYKRNCFVIFFIFFYLKIVLGEKQKATRSEFMEKLKFIAAKFFLLVFVIKKKKYFKMEIVRLFHFPLAL